MLALREFGSNDPSRLVTVVSVMLGKPPGSSELNRSDDGNPGSAMIPAGQ